MKCKLGDYIRIKHGFAFKGEYITAENNGVVLVTPGNFEIGGGFKEDKCKYFNGDYPKEYVLSPYDLIVTMTDLSKQGDTLGYSALVPKTNRVYLHNQRIGLVDVYNPKADKMFIYWLMRTQKYQKTIVATSSGSTVKHTSPSRIYDVEVDLPPIDVQKKIAAILSALDEKIAINRAINDNLQQQAASIFTEWLSTCADASTIGDMSYNILDYSPVGSEQIRLLNSSDVTEGVFPIAPLVPNKDLKGHFKKRFKFGDILYSEIRPRNHHYGFVLFDASDYIASTRLMVIRAIENKVSPAMLYQYLLLPEVEAEFTLKTESRSGTFPQGNYADMASIRVPYSPTDSQVAISETLTQIRYTIAQNQLESQRLAELRDTLLPKLMSGELDVSAIEL